MVKPVTTLVVQAILNCPFLMVLYTFLPLPVFQGFGHHADIEGLVFLAGVKAFTLQSGELLGT